MKSYSLFDPMQNASGFSSSFYNFSFSYLESKNKNILTICILSYPKQNALMVLSKGKEEFISKVPLQNTHKQETEKLKALDNEIKYC